MLKEHGGEYEKKDDWQPNVVVAENLVTGQNPASSEGAARAVLALLAG
jgi:putative intracellular protease/amidase